MRRIPHFILSFVTWLLLVWKFDAQNLLAGAAIASVSALIFGNIGINADPPAADLPRGSNFSLPKLAGFIYYVVYTLALWVQGAFTQILISLFSVTGGDAVIRNSSPAQRGGDNKKFSGAFWINTALKKTSSKFFLTHSLFYAPNIIVVDVEKDKILIKWYGTDATAPARAEKTIKELEKMIAGVLE